MDFDTARRFVLAQTLSPPPGQTAFIDCLRQGEAPIPGQVTSLLLALKTLSQSLKNEPTVERSLGHALFVLTYESRLLYLRGQAQNVDWPPLLDEDLNQMAAAVKQIWADGAE
ncbi:MAG: Dethiobiotin synthetase [Cyanobacteria bacterium P01_D01_bin.6]